MENLSKTRDIKERKIRKGNKSSLGLNCFKKKTTSVKVVRFNTVEWLQKPITPLQHQIPNKSFLLKGYSVMSKS